jgi:hypothetical protein
VLTLDTQGFQKAKQDGLVRRSGIVETFSHPNHWVLVVPTPSAPEGVERFALDENVGLIGSSDPSSTLLVKSRTPHHMFVTGWVNLQTKKTMCLSQPSKVEKALQ